MSASDSTSATDCDQSPTISEIEEEVRHSKKQKLSHPSISSISLVGRTFAGGKIGKEVGRGKFGRVYTLLRDKSNERLVVKILDKSLRVTHEIKMLKSLPPHPNLIRLRAAYELKSDDGEFPPAIGLGFNPYDSNLFSWISKTKTVCEADAVNITCQILQGLKACHERNVVHCDLKPENILIHSKSKTVVITDFGNAIIATPGGEYSTDVATIPYRAPEIAEVDGPVVSYGGEIDIWAAGCIFSEMITTFYTFPAIITSKMKDPSKLLKKLKELHLAFFGTTDFTQKIKKYLNGTPVRDEVVDAWLSLLNKKHSRPSIERAIEMWTPLRI